MTNTYFKPVVWAIAGSDNSGGAGIQADNATFADFAVHGCNIITAITAQNSEQLALVHCVDQQVLELQCETLKKDYYPAVIKLGMLASDAVVAFVVRQLASMQAQVVCDPVLKASNGGCLIETVSSYHALLPFIDVLTPNREEFMALFELSCASVEELQQAAIAVAKQHDIQLVVTGGDVNDDGEALDFCVIDGKGFWLRSPFISTANTHGTGCSFASAIASALALGYSLLDAVVLAKAYINQGLASNARFSGIKGPVQHSGFPRAIEYLPAVSVACADNLPAVFPRIDTLRLGAYPVVDSVLWLERCLQQGIRTIQLRVKNVPEAQLSAMIKQAVVLGRQYQARLFINDYWQLAIEHGAYGVHLGQDDLDTADLMAIARAGLYLGVSTHSWYEIARAHSIRPSYIAIGPIYATTTKQMPFAPQGLEQLQQWVALIGNSYPVVAIGGIDLSNAYSVLKTGVGSVAMVRAVTEAEDYRQAIQQFVQMAGA